MVIFRRKLTQRGLSTTVELLVDHGYDVLSMEHNTTP